MPTKDWIITPDEMTLAIFGGGPVKKGATRRVSLKAARVKSNAEIQLRTVSNPKIQQFIIKNMG